MKESENHNQRMINLNMKAQRKDRRHQHALPVKERLK